MASRELVLWVRANVPGAAPRNHSDARRVSVNLDALSPAARGIAEGITTARPGPGGTLELVSIRTREEMVAAMAPARAARKREEAAAFNIDLSQRDVITWDSWSPWGQEWGESPERWCERQAARLPEGYLPAGVQAPTVEGALADVERASAAWEAARDLKVARDAAIRAALAVGATYTQVGAASGLKRATLDLIRRAGIAGQG